jgi:aspartyl/asparaginyl beta-hydroxylase (cupin superfamily)
VGECIVFDDSFLHAAWNDSNEPRLVLVFDPFHPDLAGDEIAYLEKIATEMGSARACLERPEGRQPAAWVRVGTERPG